ncbi:MAG: transposase [Acidobacteria bacterium]|nr:transposase [Acidobacteriota bacterium]
MKNHLSLFNLMVCALAKPVRVAFGALFSMQRLGLSDEEIVEQIREKASMQFFVGFVGYSSKVPFDLSMMVDLCKRFSEDALKSNNELMAEFGQVLVMETVATFSDDDDPGAPGADAGNQLSLGDLVIPADWPEGMNWGTLSFDASCTPADITYPTDLKSLNKARETSEQFLDNL